MTDIIGKNRPKIDLLKELVKTDFKLRYQGSILGYLWSLVKPMALFAVLYIVFAKFLRVGADIPHYPTYLLLGIVIWTYFLEATNLGLGAIVGRGDLIRKVSISKVTIVASTSISALINFLINLVVVAIFMFFTGSEVNFELLPFIPILIIELMVLSLSIGFILSALYVRYRDFSYIWELVLQVLFYATPILYAISMIPVQFQKFALVSPLTQIIQDMRYILITPYSQTTWHSMSGWKVLIPPAIVLLLLLFSVPYFRRRSKYFAEEI